MVALEGDRTRLDCCCGPTLVLSATRLCIEHRGGCPGRTDPLSEAGDRAQEVCGDAAVAELERRGFAAISLRGGAPHRWTITVLDESSDPFDSRPDEVHHQ